ncbi:C39 family peptidase [Paenibacillus sp. GCM10027627]|uniref:C39 family peptidase n=1 Tax=unclassified Paenibacillus TaxID=185978 RepID=UPI00364122A0
MKRFLMIAVSAALIVLVFVIARGAFNTNDGGTSGNGGNSSNPASTSTPEAKPKVKQGIITIVHKDSTTGKPIRDTQFEIVDGASDRVLETLTTDATGTAKSSKLDYGANYLVKQIKIMEPFELDDKVAGVDLNASSRELSFTSTIPEYVKGYEWTADGTIDVSEVYVDVPLIMQKPELPNGCEITSLTSVLNGLGYDLTKEVMADEYLPKEPFFRKDGKLYGADPYKAYAGNPRDKIAWFVYAPPIAEAANKVFDEFGGDYEPVDISGSTREEIYAELDAGNPVVIWVTLDLSPPKITSQWYFRDTGELFKAPVNLHCVVLNGYNKANNTVHVMNPLKGQVTYDADQFFKSYDELGTHSLVIHNS